MPDSKQVGQVWAALLTFQAEFGNGFTASKGQIMERLPKDGPSEPTVNKIIDDLVVAGRLRVETTGSRKPKVYYLNVDQNGSVGSMALQGTQTSFPGTVPAVNGDPFEGIIGNVRNLHQRKKDRAARIAELDTRKVTVIAELDDQIRALNEANDEDDRRLQALVAKIQTGDMLEEPPADPDGQQEPEEPANTGEGDQEPAQGGQGAENPAEVAGTRARTTARTKAQEAQKTAAAA